MHSNKENPVDGVTAGHIYAVIGLKDTTTGDTLCDPTEQVVLESMTFPEPVIEVAIEPKTKADQEKLAIAIQKLAEEDPTFRIEQNRETGQTIIKGMGELHLDILVDRMKREFNVEANVGKPQVAYRETIKKGVERYDYTHKKQTGGSGQFAKVQIALEPLEVTAETTYEFVNKVTGGRIPREYIPSVDAGIQDAMQVGVLAGYPTVGVKATLLDGGYHEVDSSEMAFKIAGSIAYKEAARKAQPVAPRADHGRRGPHARGVHGRRHRRPELPSWPDRSRWRTPPASRSSRPACRCPRCSATSATCESKTSGRAVYSMQFEQLRRGAEERRRRDRPEEQGRVVPRVPVAGRARPAPRAAPSSPAVAPL